MLTVIGGQPNGGVNHRGGHNELSQPEQPDANEIDDGIDFGHHRLELLKAGGLHRGSLLFRKLTGLSHKIPPGNCFLYYSTSCGGLQAAHIREEKFSKKLN